MARKLVCAALSARPAPCVFQKACGDVARRTFASVSNTPADQTRFSYYLPQNNTHIDVLNKLRKHEILRNLHSHNAAVVLVSPGLGKKLDDASFMTELAKLLSDNRAETFQLLCAVVDSVTPALGDSRLLDGVSVLRGHYDTLLPQLWEEAHTRRKEDEEAVSALTFSLGRPSLTLPLARTTFVNNRPSTLLAFEYNLSGGATLEKRIEKQSQHVGVKFSQPPGSVADLGLWAPLLPITRARQITESFGNIVRGVQVNGKSTPASTELEEAVNTMFERRSEASPGPMGVWAMITQEASTGSWLGQDAPDPSGTLEGRAATSKDKDSIMDYVQEQVRSGGSLYQVLSGGGGWGPKKGLLSLDPQQSHFALSEEEEMERFVRTMDNSSFAPTGSHIQFFIPAEGTADPSATGIVFGVHSDRSGQEAAVESYVAEGHFGGLSSQGVYISDESESKLSVPNARVFVGQGKGKGSKLLGFFGGGALADAGTAALM